MVAVFSCCVTDNIGNSFVFLSFSYCVACNIWYRLLVLQYNYRTHYENAPNTQLKANFSSEKKMKSFNLSVFIGLFHEEIYV